MPTVAFATYQGLSDINDDERPVVDILTGHGIAVTSPVWDDPRVDWSVFDSVVIRSTWDYHLKADKYETWLRHFVAQSNHLWNPPGAILKNLNKKYLTLMAQSGLNVVPTHYQRRGDEIGLLNLLTHYKWQEAVVKPAISASANGTWRTSVATADDDQAKFSHQLRVQDMLIQSFVPEIVSQGEWSVIFIGGQYSHAVLKRPAAHDFRVHREFGGSSFSTRPSANIVEQCAPFLATVATPLLYARVDGVVCDDKFILMELEINEPFLFLGFSEGAAERFAQAIFRTL